MHLLSIHGNWNKHQCKGFTMFCLTVISLEIAGKNKNLFHRKRNMKSCLTGRENKHICHQEDNLLFHSFDAVHITMVTMSGLIRPEGGVNAKRRSCCTSVLIYLMDVPSVSKWRVWLGPSVTQLERAGWPVALRVPGQELWQKGRRLVWWVLGNFHLCANLWLERGKRDSQMTQVTLKGKIKAGSSQAILSRLIFRLLAKE